MIPSKNLSILKTVRVSKVLVVVGVFLIIFGILYPPNASMGLKIDPEKKIIGFFAIFLGYGCLLSGILIAPITARFTTCLKILTAILFMLLCTVLILYGLTYFWVEGYAQ